MFEINLILLDLRSNYFIFEEMFHPILNLKNITCVHVTDDIEMTKRLDNHLY